MIPNLINAYQTFNKELFEDQLPVNDFITNPKRSGIFSFSPPATVAFCKHFPDVTKQAILDDLIHQMIHIENYQRGIEDHTSNQYHKRNFCTRALEVGLNVGYDSSRGWAITSTSVDFNSKKIRRAEKKITKKLVSLYDHIDLSLDIIVDFQNQLRVEFENRQLKQYQLKYICSCDPPHNTIRSGRRPDGQRPLDASCNICNAKFVISLE